MKRQTSFLDVVKYFYVYFFSAVGTIMIIIGVYQFGEYIFNSSIAPEYRLESYREEQCDYLDNSLSGRPYAVPLEEPAKQDDISDEELAQRKQTCLENLAEERLYQQKADLFNASMLTGLGLAVFGIHFGWMRKKFP